MKCDLVFKNCKYLDVRNRKFVEGNILINNGKIIGVNKEYICDNVIDLNGKCVVPGFIDGHIHLESSIISPFNFSKIASLHGTTAVITDPHEIANVCGIDGLKYMLKKTEDLPITVYFMVPSCVPATEFDESAYTLDSNDVLECFKLDNDRILGLAEMMNYPGVIYDNPEVLKKINDTHKLGKRVDGHAPGLRGEDLKKYISAGIESDHECSTIDEAKEKIDVARRLNKEFYIMIRQGTAAKNLEALVGLINDSNYNDNVMFVTDDKHPEELKHEGHIDSIIRKAIKLGVRPEDAYVTATYNASKYFNLDNFGKIEEGCNADLVILDDIDLVNINSVYKNGKLIDEEYISNLFENEIDIELEEKVTNSIHMREVTLDDIKCDGINKQIIGLVPGELITTNEGITNNYDLDNDIIKAVVIEPHKATMHTGIAYIKGMGLKKGAVGTTVAHDSHCMILAGTNDLDIVKAANAIVKTQGGKVYVEDGEVIEILPLPIANLMTNEEPEVVIEKMKKLKDLAKVNDGVDVYMNLSFVSLPVIGDVRLLPSGAFDVKNWKIITQGELNEL